MSAALASSDYSFLGVISATRSSNCEAIQMSPAACAFSALSKQAFEVLACRNRRRCLARRCFAAVACLMDSACRADEGRAGLPDDLLPEPGVHEGPQAAPRGWSWASKRPIAAAHAAEREWVIAGLP